MPTKDKKAYAKEWYRRNRARHLATVKAYRKLHPKDPEAARAAAKRYYDTHRDKILARKKARRKGLNWRTNTPIEADVVEPVAEPPDDWAIREYFLE